MAQVTHELPLKPPEEAPPLVVHLEGRSSAMASGRGALSASPAPQAGTAPQFQQSTQPVRPEMAPGDTVRLSIKRTLEAADLDKLRQLARALSGEFREQAEELQNKRPNGAEELAAHDDLLNFFDRMASGLEELAAALDALVQSKDDERQPILRGKAAEIADKFRVGFNEWIAANWHKAIAIPIKFGTYAGGFYLLNSLGVPPDASTSFLCGLVLGSSNK